MIIASFFFFFFFLEIKTATKIMNKAQQQTPITTTMMMITVVVGFGGVVDAVTAAVIPPSPAGVLQTGPIKFVPAQSHVFFPRHFPPLLQGKRQTGISHIIPVNPVPSQLQMLAPTQ